jgi:hypothetical protein
MTYGRETRETKKAVSCTEKITKIIMRKAKYFSAINRSVWMLPDALHVIANIWLGRYIFFYIVEMPTGEYQHRIFAIPAKVLTYMNIKFGKYDVCNNGHLGSNSYRRLECQSTVGH